MGHRKLPYGYMMQSGTVVLHPEECVCVRTIFDEYQHGASFNHLVDHMKKCGTPYSEGKLWNKNMIARILSDERYTGTPPYSAIVTHEQFRAVAVRRAAKQSPIERSDVRKSLRKICDTNITTNIEQQVLLLMNKLISQPELVQPQKRTGQDAAILDNLQKKLDEVLTQQPVDEELARQLICELASAEYDSIDSSEYETQRIRYWLRTASPAEEIDEILLMKCVSKVTCTSKRTVCLKLKNGQIIERSTLS